MKQQELTQLVEAVTREVLARLGYSATGAAAPGRRVPLIAANWKMNPTKDALAAYLAELADVPAGLELLLIPPAVLIPPARAGLDALGRSDFKLGAQCVHWEAAGAHTGELSSALLCDAGASWALAGHSERREAGVTDAEVGRRAAAGLAGGLSMMVCIGESAGERASRSTFRVLRNQLQAALAPIGMPLPDPERLAVAYEPVWAIGTGQRALPADIQEACAFIRGLLGERFGWATAQRVRVLYGGSVKPASTGEVMALPDVDGVLVGGASLGGRSFRDIAVAAAEASAETGKEGRA